MVLEDEDKLGAGIALADQDDVDDGAYAWDFVIDETGDLDHTRGREELYKDLSFQIAARLDGKVGVTHDSENLRDIGVDVERILSHDPRVDGLVRETIVSPSPNDPDAINIAVFIQAASGDEYDFVFRVSP